MVWLLRAIACTLLARSSTGECEANARVGSCFGIGCFAGHGQASCSGMTCFCSEGYCSKDGMYCEAIPTLPPPTTTNIVDSYINEYDYCHVKEYMQEGTYIQSYSTCQLQKCAPLVFTEKEKIPCCSLQCTADEVKKGLPDCWPVLRKHFTKIAQNMGSTGKGRRTMAVCTLIQPAGPMLLDEVEADDSEFDNSEFEAQINDFIAKFTPKATESTVSPLVVMSYGCILAGLITVTIQQRRQRVTLRQPPLLA